MDDLIDGTIDGWPVSVQLIRNPGEPFVTLHAAPYTGQDDEPVPQEIMRKCMDMPEQAKDRREAMRLLRATGFEATA